MNFIQIHIIFRLELKVINNTVESECLAGLRDISSPYSSLEFNLDTHYI